MAVTATPQSEPDRSFGSNLISLAPHEIGTDRQDEKCVIVSRLPPPQFDGACCGVPEQPDERDNPDRRHPN